MPQRAALPHNIQFVNIFHESYQMSCTGVEEPVAGPVPVIRLCSAYILHSQTDNSRRIGESRRLAGEKFRLMRAVRSLETEILVTEIRSEGHYAPAPVAAHHAAGAVGIVIAHTEVIVSALLKHHQAVSPESGVAVAQ